MRNAASGDLTITDPVGRSAALVMWLVGGGLSVGTLLVDFPDVGRVSGGLVGVAISAALGWRLWARRLVVDDGVIVIGNTWSTHERGVEDVAAVLSLTKPYGPWQMGLEFSSGEVLKCGVVTPRTIARSSRRRHVERISQVARVLLGPAATVKDVGPSPERVTLAHRAAIGFAVFMLMASIGAFFFLDSPLGRRFELLVLGVVVLIGTIAQARRR